jgi:uncharacterized delta-60 repeat protein
MMKRLIRAGRRCLMLVLLVSMVGAGTLSAAEQKRPGSHGRGRSVQETNAGRSTAAGSLRHADRWAGKRDAGQLPAAFARVLRRGEEKGTTAALRRGKRPWEHMVPKAPRVSRPGGLSGEATATVDSVLASWVKHYSSGLAPSTDAISAITSDAAGNIYVAGYTTGIFTGSDFLTIKYNSAGVQQWVATYSGPGNDYDAATSIGVDPSGNVIVAGSSYGTMGDEDYATIKYSPSGQQLWVARYDGTAHDYDAALALNVDSGGNIVVTGVSQGLDTDGDYVTIKYTAAGAEFWVRRYNGTGSDFDIPAGLGVDLSGSVYVSGTSIGLDSWEDFVTVKYSFAGDQVWVARYDGPGNDYDAVGSIAVDIAGNSYVTGSSYNVNFDADIATIKYDTFGNASWTSRYNSPDESDEIASALVIDASRNVYVTGNSFGFGTGEDYLTIKYSATGSIRWIARYSGTGNAYDAAASVAVDGSGSVYVTGVSTGLATLEDMVTVKYSSLGIQVWAQRYVGPINDYDAGVVVRIDASGNPLVGGSSYGLVTDEDALFVKYNSSGVEQWAARYNGPGNSADEAVGVALDPLGNIYVTGTSYDLQSQSDFATVKYSPSGQQLWVVRFDGTGEGEDFVSALTVDASGNVYVTGTSFDLMSGYDIVTLKYNTNGVLIWTNRYTSAGNAIDEAADIAVDGFGNVHVTGSRTAPVTGVDIVTVKYLASGSQSWVATYNNGSSDSTDEGYDIALDLAGNVYVAGTSYRDETNYDCMTIKYNGSGVQQWAARYNGPGNLADFGYSLVVDGSSAVVNGVTHSAASGQDFVTLRYNSTGGQQWARNYSTAGTADDIPTSLALGGGGMIYVGGTSHSTLTGFDFIVVKYSSAGVQQWISAYDSPENDDDVVTTMALDVTGNIYVSGYSFLLLSGYDYATVKYAPSGALLWVARFDNPAQFNDEPRSIGVDGSGNVYVAGYSETDDGSVYSVLKYEPPQAAFNRALIAFPSSQVGCRKDDTLVVRNPSGTNLLEVSSVVPTDQNFTVLPATFTVPAGDSARVAVRFAPLSAGSKSAWLVFNHNGLSSPDSVQVTGSGTGSGTAILVTAIHVPGWRLYALPVGVACQMVIPYSYAFSGGYFRSDTLVNGRGYWTKLTDPEMHFTGFPITADSVPVTQGWNLIGAISYPVRVLSVTSIPDSIIRTAFFGYSGAYAAADSLRPARGYWVKASQAGSIVVRQGAMAGPGAAVPALPDDAGRLTVTDAAGATQELHFLAGDPTGRLREYYELPPPPPGGLFDARFASDRLVEVAAGVGSRDLPLVVSSHAQPVTISWPRGAPGIEASLVVAGRVISLRDAGSLVLDDATTPVSIRILGKAAVPTIFGLEQNYPNPFNPSTDIAVRVPVRSTLTLRVYDLLGREVRTLLSEVVDAGVRTVVWDARDGNGMPVAGGVYFCRLEATDISTHGRMFTDTRKMLLLR